MNDFTLQDLGDDPALSSFELHRRARRERALAIHALFLRLAAHLANAVATLRRPATLDLRWG